MNRRRPSMRFAPQRGVSSRCTELLMRKQETMTLQRKAKR